MLLSLEYRVLHSASAATEPEVCTYRIEPLTEFFYQTVWQPQFLDGSGYAEFRATFPDMPYVYSINGKIMYYDSLAGVLAWAVIENPFPGLPDVPRELEQMKKDFRVKEARRADDSGESKP